MVEWEKIWVVFGEMEWGYKGDTQKQKAQGYIECEVHRYQHQTGFTPCCQMYIVVNVGNVSIRVPFVFLLTCKDILCYLFMSLSGHMAAAAAKGVSQPEIDNCLWVAKPSGQKVE